MNRKENNMDNKLKEFPEKKDLIYWIIIMFLALVTVSVWRVDSPKTLTEQISLGAALFSILLAVVGIIIPYIQGNETNRQNFKILGEINRVSENLVQLNSLKDEMAKQLEEQDKLSKKYAEVIANTADKLEGSSTEVDSDELKALKEMKKQLEKNVEQLNYEKHKIYSNDNIVIKHFKSPLKGASRMYYALLKSEFGNYPFSEEEAHKVFLKAKQGITLGETKKIINDLLDNDYLDMTMGVPVKFIVI